jgi:signal transduction histidine kinase
MAMNRMIMNLLDIGRSEDGALVPRPEAVAVRALLDEVGAEAARRAADRGQRLVIESEALEVRADRDLLRRVLENLVDNSLRYSPEGSTVRLEARADAGAVELRVRDDGLGVPAAYRERIFEKYVTLDPASSAEVRSSRGLGLVFCRLAVAAHGGRIWVEDNHPRGSTFCVRLPAGG